MDAYKKKGKKMMRMGTDGVMGRQMKSMAQTKKVESNFSQNCSSRCCFLENSRSASRSRERRVHHVRPFAAGRASLAMRDAIELEGNGMQVPKWIPYTVMKGGWSANALAKAQGTKLGKNLYGDTLIKNIGQAFYKDLNKIESSIRQNIPLLKYARELEYGFKIRDKEKPDEWYLTEDIQLLPSKAEVETGGILDNVKDFFTGKKKLF